MTHTAYSFLTDDELLSRVSNSPAPTDLELELATRLQSALDELDEAEEELDVVHEVLEEAGINLELAFCESSVQ